jgi:hypothetical protein
VIGIRYQLAPSGIWNEPGVYFDAARSKERLTWRRDPSGGLTTWNEAYPPNLENANDDTTNDDESTAPSSQGGFFAIDCPGWPTAFNEGYARLIYRGNFSEFCRVGFTGRPSGSLAGSRCSAYYQWNAWHWLVPDAVLWKRSTGDSAETDDNHVEPGQRPIGSEPPFP